MNKVGIIILGFFIMVIAGEAAFAQKEKYHSIFIYNFSKYVKWPNEKSNGEFVIGVYGSSEIVEDLKVMAESKKAMVFSGSCPMDSMSGVTRSIS